MALGAILGAILTACITGCGNASHSSPLAARSAAAESHLAAYAATVRYPASVKPSTDLAAAALINPKTDTVKVVNFSDQPMRDVDVWVNGAFVCRTDVIPSHGSVMVSRNELFDATGKNMARQDAHPKRVEVQMGEHLYALGEARTD